ncbi:MAG: BMP family ABC transporter substrate-binding protein, partial [Spirochaetales bacterium]|nr:BMP family ABC transporter substrate-binding protein [Candidatus Physcosoma equi]
MKKVLAIALMAVLCFSAFAQGQPAAPAAGADDEIEVVLLTDATGIDDKSFNAAAWRGILEFYGDNGANRGKLYENITAQTSDDYVPNMKNAAEADWDLIIVTGFTWGDACEEVSALYPDQKFIIVDVDYLTNRDNLI